MRCLEYYIINSEISENWPKQSEAFVTLHLLQFYHTTMRPLNHIRVSFRAAL